MNKLQNVKISYTEVHGAGAVYRQQVLLTEKQYIGFTNKISKTLREGVEYGNYLKFPEVDDFKDAPSVLFFLNLSTARLLKSMVTQKQQKRFKMDVNTFIKIKD